MISTGYWSKAGLVLGGAVVCRDPPGGRVDRRARLVAGARRARLLAWFGIRGIGSVYYAVYFAGYELRDAAPRSCCRRCSR